MVARAAEVRLRQHGGGGRLTACTSLRFHPHWRTLLSEYASLLRHTHALYRGEGACC
jgi:hypothetical protein